MNIIPVAAIDIDPKVERDSSVQRDDNSAAMNKPIVRQKIGIAIE